MPLERNRDNDYEYSHNSFAKCPHCDYEDQDSWEIQDDGEVSCGHCGKDFWVSVNTEITYSTDYLKKKKS